MAFMIGVVALAGLEFDELLDEVVGVLALEDRVGRHAARAVVRVARGADRLSRSPRPWPDRGARGRLGSAREATPARRRAPASRAKRGTGFMSERNLSCQSRRFYNDAFATTTSTRCRLLRPPPEAAGDDDATATQGARLDAHGALPHDARAQLDQLPADRAARDRLRRPLQRRQVDRDQHADAAEASRVRVEDAGPHAAHQPVRARPEARAPTRCSPTCPATATRRWRAAPSCAGSR